MYIFAEKSIFELDNIAKLCYTHFCNSENGVLFVNNRFLI